MTSNIFQERYEVLKAENHPVGHITVSVPDHSGTTNFRSQVTVIRAITVKVILKIDGLLLVVRLEMLPSLA